MSELSLETEVALLKQTVERLEEELREVKKESSELKSMATRWKGFGAALMALGGGAGFIFSQIEHIKMFLGLAAKVQGH